MINKFSSSKQVISQAYRMLNLQQEERWQDMIEWIGEGMDFIGAYYQYEEKPAKLQIKNFQAPLPCDFVDLLQINYLSEPMTHSASTLRSYYDQDNSIDISSVGRRDNNFLATYNIVEPWIKTNIKEGEIVLAYTAMKLDEDGFPLIPDNISYKSALTWYIVYMMLLGGYNHPKLRWQDAEDRWHHYCGQARGKMNMPDLGQMETIRKTLIRLIPQVSLARDFFREATNNDGILRRD